MSMMLEGDPMSDDGIRKRKGIETPGPDEIYQECLRRQTIAAAIEGLKFYNYDMQEKGVSYTLDEPLKSHGFRRMGVDVIHVNFTAKKKDGSEISFSSEQFFAEVTYSEPFKSWLVYDCVTFDPADQTSSHISDFCTMCNKALGILHPAGHYVLGQYPEYHYIHFEYENDDTLDDLRRLPVPV